MNTIFPVQFTRALPTLGIFAFIGLLAAAAALVNVAIAETEAKQPWALLGLVLGLPGLWFVFLISLATISLRITDGKIEKLIANRWIVASKPLGDLRSASIVQNTLQLAFVDGSTIHLAAMPLRDQALLESVLSERCPDAQIF